MEVEADVVVLGRLLPSSSMHVPGRIDWRVLDAALLRLAPRGQGSVLNRIRPLAPQLVQRHLAGQDPFAERNKPVAVRVTHAIPEAALSRFRANGQTSH